VLFPTVVLVEWFSSIDFLFNPRKGYVAVGLPVVIGPSCAGLNFLVITLNMSVFSFIGRFSRNKLYGFLGFVVMGFLLTLCVNAFRILGGLLLLQVNQHISVINTTLAHSVQGTLFYFFFLVLYFSVLYTMFNKREA
jgi:exosortase K